MHKEKTERTRQKYVRLRINVYSMAIEDVLALSGDVTGTWLDEWNGYFGGDFEE